MNVSTGDSIGRFTYLTPSVESSLYRNGKVYTAVTADAKLHTARRRFPRTNP